MKKISTLLLALFVSTSVALSQNVAKECVLFEVFTGVNCPYCPAAANAIGEMLEAGYHIAPVAYHTSAFSTADFYTTETNTRASFYGINSYPTLKADGIKSMSGGGGASESMMSYYVPLYNQRINQTSPYTIDLSCSAPEGSEYTVTCTVNEVGTGTSSNLKVHIVLTQSNIQRSWQGMSSLNYVVRDMIPNQNGTAYPGGELTITETFDMGDLPKEDCYLTAWVQDANTKEVFQAVRLDLNYPDFEYDVSVNKFGDVATYNCSGTTSAFVTVKNNGSEAITSFDVVVYADDEEVAREQWSGDPIEYSQTTNINIPTFNFGDATNVTVSVENPNGHEDQNPYSNFRNLSFEPAIAADEHIILVFRTDDKYEETSVEWINMTTGVVEQTLTFDKPNKMYVNELNFNELACYRLAIYDSGNDGITTYFTVYSKDEQALYNGQSALNPFNSMVALEFEPTALGIEEDINKNDIIIYPNPSNGIFNIENGTNFAMFIYDILGREVYNNPNAESSMVDLSFLEKGIYMVKIDDGKKMITKKIVIE